MKEKKPFIFKLARMVCTPVFKLIYRYEITNRNNIPPQGAYIVACNHQSYSDPVLLGIGQKRIINFMAKEELFRNKFFAALIRSLGAFPVHRGGTGDQTAINNAQKLLLDGRVLGIFPEGKRSLNGELLKLRAGAVMLAYQCNVPIIPACITAKGGKMKMFNKVKITYGDPISCEQLGITQGSGKELREATKKLAEKIAAIREKDKF
ncbi:MULTISPECIES: 1-acyl-sn-glycerol-3-phosphate acyltransferase [unclassified Ruminococcus]|uniref:lysophospholipid acyltransferase family protein n=1 Tax=unclassified Ruminococcus TaxID=2608920 RepID=UPI00210E3EBC|nr:MULTISPECIES: lysophospholipid acyltransferase family protein [unclassified Ruminococcus]MCQ4021852.1 1-acylglycerol-3-phosphate O-acyltransferase [Ruminococcus sp. zg-924]MCQ4114297.1 1-acylglycerol-3-phosphate O-acyltransferase [Ruminococcus sp. zg-921]